MNLKEKQELAKKMVKDRDPIHCICPAQDIIGRRKCNKQDIRREFCHYLFPELTLYREFNSYRYEPCGPCPCSVAIDNPFKGDRLLPYTMKEIGKIVKHFAKLGTFKAYKYSLLGKKNP